MTYPSTKTDELYGFIQLIRPAHRRLARAVAANLEGTGLTVGMRAVMAVLASGGGRTVPDIARTLFLARQQVQLLANGLEELGLAVRRPNPAHKRSPLFCLTAEGTDRFATVRAKENEEVDRIASQFSPEELETAQRVIRAIVDHFAPFEDDPDHPKGIE
jgi:DNA-binding MarR family transcriptional regulator